MEEELKCPVCKNFYLTPVLLPCYHAMCLNCAITLQVNSNLQNSSSSSITSSTSGTSSVIERAESITSATSTNSSSVSGSGSNSGPGSGTGSDHVDFLEIDKLSILSETDSGVMCYSSRPNSLISSLLYNTAHTISTPPTTISLTCPTCQKTIYFDENGSLNLPKYKLMQDVLEKYKQSKQISLKCQMCVEQPAKEAIIKCDQCQVLYCEKCRESCHPSRGPLATHIMYDPKRIQNSTLTEKDKCFEHPDEPLTKFCNNCKSVVCNTCLIDNCNHRNHEIQSLAVICKSQKVRHIIFSL